MHAWYLSHLLTRIEGTCYTVESTRSQAVARIADRTAKNCRGHVTWATPTFRENFCAPACHSPYEAVYQIWSL